VYLHDTSVDTGPDVCCYSRLLLLLLLHSTGQGTKAQKIGKVLQSSIKQHLHGAWTLHSLAVLQLCASCH
jgi:hypothetical protein